LEPAINIDGVVLPTLLATVVKNATVNSAEANNSVLKNAEVKRVN